MTRKRFSFLWFMIGIGSNLQIVFSLSLSELLVLVAAPLLVASEMQHMRRMGVLSLWGLSVLVILGCGVACVANHTQPAFALRGFAVCFIVSASIIFSHWIIRNDPAGFKWMLLGSSISIILCIFVFRRSVEVTMYGNDVQSIVGGQLFWVQRISPWILLPTKGWYMQQLPIVNMCAPLVCALIAVLFSQGSGRSAALSFIAFSALAVVGGRKRSTMMRVSRHFGLIVLVAAITILTLNSVYRIAATRGWLGEKAYAKYELQTRGEKGIMRLLLGGRADAFIGLLACRDKPIVGWGPWAMDTRNYRGEFMAKYGTIEDYEDQIKREIGNFYEHRLNLISCHSHITEFWLWYGMFGLIFMVYIMYVFIRYLHEDVAAVPQWYAWIACSIPGMMWHIFFSPFSSRVTLPMMVVACLMARAVRKGSFMLPYKMRMEIDEMEHRQ